MELNKKKCSLKEHNNSNAIIYCVDCKVYMCNKCDNFHSKLFPYHKVFNIEKDNNEIFIEYCNEEGHNHNKLEYFCKGHNKLCCASCIAKIRKKENGKHNECDVCIIEDIKEEKKNKIKENIKYLEELYNSVQDSINEIKNIYNSINGKKEEIKIKIQQVFTKLRKELNSREDKLLEDVDKEFNDSFGDEVLIRKCDNLPEKIKKSLEVIKNIDKEGDNENIIQFINNCINVEDNIKDILVINENIKKNKEFINIKINFYPDEEAITPFLNNIKNFGEIHKIEKIEIDNPWSNEQFKYNKVFYYALKNNNYLAEKISNDGYIHLIKSKYKFKKDKIYHLIFIPTIKYKGDFHIGFADFKKSNDQPWLKFKNSVALTNEGLLIDGSNKNANLKIENGYKYEFIIDISQKCFTLKINENESGKFNFDFEGDIYAHAGIRNVGNSISIQTYEK